ncbi:MAG: hypothetical protein AB8A46_02640, partial [Prochlorococcus sp.]
MRTCHIPNDHLGSFERTPVLHIQRQESSARQQRNLSQYHDKTARLTVFQGLGHSSDPALEYFAI